MLVVVPATSSHTPVVELNCRMLLSTGLVISTLLSWFKFGLNVGRTRSVRLFPLMAVMAAIGALSAGATGATFVRPPGIVGFP